MNAENMKEPGTKVRRMRWWMPIAICIIAAATIVFLQTAPELPVIKKVMFTMLTVLCSALLLLVWFMFFSAFRWRTRFATVALLVVAFFGLGKLVRFDGSVNGSGTPRLVWKWTPKSTGAVKTSPIGFVPTTAQGKELEAAMAYPGFLGNDRTGVIQGEMLDKDWASHPPQQLWRQPVGLGWAGFAVAGSRAITQEQRDENELVVAYDLGTGRMLWAHTNHARFSEKMGGDGPRATPTILGDRVYAVGATGILDCMDLTTGKLIWSRDTLEENHLPNLVFGKSSSPLVVDNLVIVTGGETNGPTLFAYRAEDGSNVWKSGTDHASYTSPMLVTLCGKRQVLSVNASSLTAHNPGDGTILWTYNWPGWGPRCAQPVVLEGDRVFLSAGFGVGCALIQVKADAGGKIEATELWKNLRLKTQFSSAVARGGYVYGLDEGVLACINLSTGERAWKDGHYGYGQLVMVDDVLLVQTEPGQIVLVQADASGFKELARSSALNSKTWNNPAVAGEFLLTRNDQEAVCYRLPLRKPSPIN